MDFGVVDVDALAEISRGQGESDVRTYVFVDKGRVRSFPSCDTAAAVAQKNLRRLDPGGAETVNKVCLAGDDAFMEVCVSEFAHVNLISLVSFSSHSTCKRIESVQCPATEADRMRRSIGVVSPCIREINIVCPEIDIAERCILWHGIPCRA